MGRQLQRKARATPLRTRAFQVAAEGGEPAIKIIEKYDSEFTLKPEAQETLYDLLKQDSFGSEVAQQKEWSVQAEFTEILFQPVPWSMQETRGMPNAYEKYLDDPENHVVINVPPNFMFKSMIFSPNRLCAIFRKEGASEPVEKPKPVEEDVEEEESDN